MSDIRRVRARRPLVVVGLVMAVIAAGSTAALATFGDIGTVGSNQFSTATLAPPSGLNATLTCNRGSSGAVPTFVASSQTTGFNGPVTVPRPLGTQIGDVLIAQIAADDTNSVSAPGWTLIRQDKDAGEGFWQAILYRVAGSSEPASYTLTPSQSVPGEIVFGVNAYRGVDPVAPINAQGGQITSSFISTVTAPSITTTVANTRLVTFWGRDGNEFLNAPAGMTQRWALNGASLPQDIAGTSADETRPTVGTTGTRVATAGSSNNGIGHAVALTPLTTAASADVDAAWTVTPSGFAEGYRLQRWRGVTLESDQVVGGSGTTGATDGPLVAGETYEYRLFAEYQSWTSSVVTTSVTVTCAPPPSSTEGTAIWRHRSDNRPWSTTWDGSTFANAVTTTTVGQWRIVQAAASTSRDEVIAVGVNTGNRVTAQMRTAGTWVDPFGAALGSPSQSTWWGADVAYESSSGDAILVWNNGTNGSTGVSYRVWDGSSWSSEATVTTPLAGEPQQMHLAAHPTSDEMVLVVSNQNSRDYAMVWDGASWVGADDVVLDIGGGDARTDVDVAYEQQTGRAMVTYGRTSSSVRYRLWDGTAWSGESSLTAPGGVNNVRWTVLAADPTSDHLALGVLTEGSDTWLAVWDGSGWVETTLATNDAAQNDAPVVAVGFEGLTGQAIAAYGRGASGRVQFRTWASGAGWTAEQNGPDLGNRGNRLNTMVLEPRPGSDELALGVQDDASDLTYLIWDGTAWGATSELERDTNENKHQPFAWVWT